MTPRRTCSIIFRETGLAMAVLALWMLALLAPLHQGAGVLRDMARSGGGTATVWILCQAGTTAGGGDDHALPLCPAQGIGKSDLMLPPVIGVQAAVMTLVAGVLRPAATPRLAFDPRLTPLQPRAPPALI